MDLTVRRLCRDRDRSVRVSVFFQNVLRGLPHGFFRVAQYGGDGGVLLYLNRFRSRDRNERTHRRRDRRQNKNDADHAQHPFGAAAGREHTDDPAENSGKTKTEQYPLDRLHLYTRRLDRQDHPQTQYK